MKNPRRKISIFVLALIISLLVTNTPNNPTIPNDSVIDSEHKTNDDSLEMDRALIFMKLMIFTPKITWMFHL